MQRWIVAVMVLVVLLAGGLAAGYKLVYKPNRPNPIWVPLQIREDVEMAERQKIVKELTKKLSEPKILEGVSKDLDLAAKWKMASNEEAAKEVGRRLFVRTGETLTPDGAPAPAILVGVNGKLKEVEQSKEIAMRLMKDVFEIVGIKVPAKAAD
jgi:hypothetical protein